MNKNECMTIHTHGFLKAFIPNKAPGSLWWLRAAGQEDWMLLSSPLLSGVGGCPPFSSLPCILGKLFRKWARQPSWWLVAGGGCWRRCDPPSLMVPCAHAHVLPHHLLVRGGIVNGQPVLWELPEATEFCVHFQCLLHGLQSQPLPLSAPTVTTLIQFTCISHLSCPTCHSHRPHLSVSLPSPTPSSPAQTEREPQTEIRSCYSHKSHKGGSH